MLGRYQSHPSEEVIPSPENSPITTYHNPLLIYSVCGTPIPDYGKLSFPHPIPPLTRYISPRHTVTWRMARYLFIPSTPPSTIQTPYNPLRGDPPHPTGGCLTLGLKAFVPPMGYFFHPRHECCNIHNPLPGNVIRAA